MNPGESRRTSMKELVVLHSPSVFPTVDIEKSSILVCFTQDRRRLLYMCTIYCFINALRSYKNRNKIQVAL